MIQIIINSLNQIIGGIERLGTLSVGAVWAFFTVILIAYIVWDIKVKKSAEKEAWEARIKEAEADGMMATAVERLADQIKEIRYKLRCIGGSGDTKD